MLKLCSNSSALSEKNLPKHLTIPLIHPLLTLTIINQTNRTQRSYFQLINQTHLSFFAHILFTITTLTLAFCLNF